MTMKIVIVALLFTWLFCQVNSLDTLKMVLGIQRHCARDDVPYYGLNSIDERDWQCLSSSIEDAKVGGDLLAARYFPLLPDTLDYSPFMYILEASDAEQTLETGQAVIQGLFDKVNIVSRSTEDACDYRLRGFDKCKLFGDKVNDWTQSSEYVQKDQETAEFRNRLALPLNLSSELIQWIDVYDSYTLQYIYKQRQGYPAAPLINSTDYQQIKDLANWVESRRYGKNIAGPYPANGLIGDIRNKLTFQPQPDTPYDYKFIMYFAYHSTIMSLWSALQFDPTTWPANQVPSFLATFFLELHDVDGQEDVRLVFSNNITDGFNNVTWPSVGGPCDGLAACPLENFLQMTQFGTDSLQEFCTYCGTCGGNGQLNIISESSTQTGGGNSSVVGGLVALIVILVLISLALSAYILMPWIKEKNLMQPIKIT